LERIWPSKHFGEQWRERVGGDVPSASALGRLIQESVFCQKQRDLFTPRGIRYRVLAVYWHPERDLVIKVDEAAGRAVTVLTPETGQRQVQVVRAA